MSTSTDLGLAGREDSWNYEADAKWFLTYSANELVFACGEEHPTLSATRALGLLVEQFGPEVVSRSAWSLVTEAKKGTDQYVSTKEDA